MSSTHAHFPPPELLQFRHNHIAIFLNRPSIGRILISIRPDLPHLYDPTTRSI